MPTFSEQVENTSIVNRTGRVCTDHTIPDMPVYFYQANAAYLNGILYVCGGYNPDFTGDGFYHFNEGQDS